MTPCVTSCLLSSPTWCACKNFLAFRSFAEDGTFQDTVRVNLTTDREAGQLLVATWGKDVEGATVQALVPILEQLDLRLAAEPGISSEEPPETDSAEG